MLESTCPRTLYNVRLSSNVQIIETTEMVMEEADEDLKMAGQRIRNLEKSELEPIRAPQNIMVLLPLK